jgi:hypothetical protein
MLGLQCRILIGNEQLTERAAKCERVSRDVESVLRRGRLAEVPKVMRRGGRGFVVKVFPVGETRRRSKAIKSLLLLPTAVNMASDAL